MAGRFIVLEGIDGAGKTTQAKLLSGALRRRGARVVYVREPGGTAAGEKIRRLLLDRRSRMEVACELYLYMAARAQLVAERIRPALRAGRTVVCDRFLYSSAAYQGEAGGVGVRAVLDLGRLAVDGVEPDRVLILDLDPRLAWRRKLGAGSADRIERRGLAYQRAVRRGFRRVARLLGRRAALIEAAADPADVHRRILRELGVGA
jgi:dTMP kinase